jgi:exodeoxyribonuclease III
MEQQSLFGAFSHRTPVVDLSRWGIVTWNIQHAAPKRAWNQVEWLAKQSSADVVALTEVGSGRAAQAVEKALTCYGYETYFPRNDSGDYCVALATRIGTLRALTLAPDHLPHRGVVGSVEMPGNETITVASIYVPSRGPKEQRNVAKRAFQDAVIRMLPKLLSESPGGGPVLIAGDLNVVEPGHQPHHPVFGEWEYEFYRSFGRTGLVDCFRHLNTCMNGYSWYGRSGLGFRFDHLFINKTHAGRVLSCQYQHGPRLEGLSDHSAMEAVIGTADHKSN